MGTYSMNFFNPLGPKRYTILQFDIYKILRVSFYTPWVQFKMINEYRFNLIMYDFFQIYVSQLISYESMYYYFYNGCEVMNCDNRFMHVRWNLLWLKNAFNLKCQWFIKGVYHM